MAAALEQCSVSDMACNRLLLGIVPKWRVLLCLQLSFIYLAALLLAGPGAVWLFIVLFLTQLFRVWQVFGFCHTVWPRPAPGHMFRSKYTEAVALLIATVGEDLVLLERTVCGAIDQNYGNFQVYILNDAFVRNSPRWEEVERLASRLGVTCITRKIGGGAKAGNINNGLKHTQAPFVAIFDVDHVPAPNFLNSLMGHFADEHVAAVQSPQYYRNKDSSFLARVAWEQQRIFYSAIVNGKNAIGSVFMCGTNMIIRRTALQEVGGFDETSVAEDFATSILMHSKGWKTVYVPTVLADGLAPEDIPSYYRQQMRWARGSLGSAIKYRTWKKAGLSPKQRFQYTASASYFLCGVCGLCELLFPILYFYCGLKPISNIGPLVWVSFGAFVAATISVVWRSTAGALTPSVWCFSISNFAVHMHALISMGLGRKTGFAVTSKTALRGSFLRFAIPHLLYCLLVGIGLDVAFVREGSTAPFWFNMFWACLNVVCFVPFIAACLDGNVDIKHNAGDNRRAEDYYPRLSNPGKLDRLAS